MKKIKLYIFIESLIRGTGNCFICLSIFSVSLELMFIKRKFEKQLNLARNEVVKKKLMKEKEFEDINYLGKKFIMNEVINNTIRYRLNKLTDKNIYIVDNLEISHFINF